MSYSLRQEWRALLDCPSGERFERRYRRARRLQDHHEFLQRVFRLFLSVVIFAMGVGAIFLPFPEIILFAASGALLAAESLALARFLDRVELGASRQWECFSIAPDCLRSSSGWSPSRCQSAVWEFPGASAARFFCRNRICSSPQFFRSRYNVACTIPGISAV